MSSIYCLGSIIFRKWIIEFYGKHVLERGGVNKRNIMEIKSHKLTHIASVDFNNCRSETCVVTTMDHIMSTGGDRRIGRCTYGLLLLLQSILHIDNLCRPDERIHQRNHCNGTNCCCKRERTNQLRLNIGICRYLLMSDIKT